MNEAENNLEQLTKELLACTEEAAVHYRQARERGTKPDFYAEVKPFADHAKHLLDNWLPAAAGWIIDNRPKNLHENQIASAAEHIELITVQCFFPETSRTRFINYYNSTKYVLNVLLGHLDGKK
jgi:hypothetical protein